MGVLHLFERLGLLLDLLSTYIQLILHGIYNEHLFFELHFVAVLCKFNVVHGRLEIGNGLSLVLALSLVFRLVSDVGVRLKLL